MLINIKIVKINYIDKEILREFILYKKMSPFYASKLKYTAVVRRPYIMAKHIRKVSTESSY